MTVEGRVRELWRYPVKSMRGERVERSDVVETYGMPGDRGWAIRDDDVGEIRSAKKLTELVQLAARYVSEPSGATTPIVEIDLGDGRTVRSDDPEITALLSDRLCGRVTLWPRRPAEDLEHYRRIEQPDEDELRRQLALLPDDPLPDYSTMAPDLLAELSEFVAPRGTYFDAFELHLLSTASLASVAAATPGCTIDVRRFRPNILVDLGPSVAGYPEIDWCGRRVRIGSVVADVVQPMSRCVMTTLPQAELPRERAIMRTLVRDTAMDLGVGLSVVEPGHIAEGDTVEVIE
ncbi:MAG TPA: MOSC N-terminal beta barrel domain-containing protein [Acidimicrobiia bacterium]|nr:MOSC N-terminal beta barrel domain-containing protein [Acidimicrobiia bacterium]